MTGKRLRVSLALVLFMVLVAAGSAGNEGKLKVFISVDMEGIAGVVNGDQTSISGSGYALARRWMTGEVNAAVRGALKAGATEIVVNDSHGSMRNVIISELHDAAVLITGSPKPLSMMQGIDSSFDAAMFIGYHARAGSKDGVLDHTYSGSSVFSVKVNGLELGETGLNALVAGTYDVPVVLVTGDATLCAQAAKTLGDELETAVVKEAVGRYAAKSLTPENACRLIEEKAEAALKKRTRIKPFKLSPPYRFEVTFLRSAMADPAELIPRVERTGARSVRFQAQDYIQGLKLFRALIGLAR